MPSPRLVSRREFAAASFAALCAVRPACAALRVNDLAACEAFYRKFFGAPGIIFEKPGQRYLRMGRNFVALFERDEPAMDHFAVSVEAYDPDEAESKARELGLKPRRAGSFVYVQDPDGLEVQICHTGHEVDAPVVREAPASSVFRGNGVNHAALRVTGVERSRDFYQELFGLPVIRQSGQSCFLGLNGNFLALFAGATPEMDHYCISIDDYDPAEAMETLRSEGLSPRRAADRVYFDDPSGHEVQISAADHSA